jgi:hypothetical protein
MMKPVNQNIYTKWLIHQVLGLVKKMPKSSKTENDADSPVLAMVKKPKDLALASHREKTRNMVKDGF